jgi:hypothetical protein
MLQGSFYAGMAACIFLFTSITFILYDCLVQRLQQRVLRSAERNNEIVSSLFPQSFRLPYPFTPLFGVPASAVVFLGGVVGAILHPDVADLGQQPYCIDQGFLAAPE